MFAAEFVYKLGIRYRNPLISDRLSFLMESQHWSQQQLRAHQDRMLSELVRHAFDNSPFYSRLYRAHGVDPRSIRSAEQIETLPLVEKADLIENSATVQVPDYPGRCFYSETSGSTGSPLVFYRDADWDAWHQASWIRGLAWHGVEPWDRNGYLWGFNLSPLQRFKTAALDILQNRFRLFSYSDREIEEFVTKLRGAVFLGGYSSMIYEIAKYVNASGRAGELSLKFIRGTSEKILDSYQIESEKAFGRRISSEYAAAEAGIIAFECAEGNMHLNSETVIVESIDGRIAVTNLVSRSFPVIRYLLGDEIVLDEDSSCPCGRAHQLLTEVTGRIGAKIVGKNQSYPSLTLYYVFKNLAQDQGLVLNYQAVQDRPGALDILLDRAISADESDALGAEIEKYFSHDLDVEIVQDVNLRSTSRKKRDFVSNL